MAIGILLAVALGCFLIVWRRKNAYPAALGGPLVGAAFATFLGASLWFVLPITAIVAIVGYIALWRRASGKPLLPVIAPAATAIIVGSIIASLIAIGNSNTPAHGNVTNTPSPGEIKDLTITTVNYTCATDSNGLVPWKIGALDPNRKNADDVSTSFKSSDPTAMVNEVKQTICEDPLYGAQVANYFANLHLGTFALASRNSWLNGFGGDGATVINAKADTYIPLRDVQHPTAQQVADAVAKNKEWQGTAAKLATLVSKFKIEGIHADSAILNYHVLVGGLVAGDLPPIGLNDHGDNLTALVIYLAEKGNYCLVRQGFNLEDKRIEQFNCVITPVPGPSTTPTAPGTPTHPGTTTPPGGCKTGCVTTPPTTPPTTPSPSCTYTSPKGTCYGGKSPAPQPSGVGNPSMTSPGSVNNTPPPTKSTPLQPQPSGGHTTQPTAPGATPVPSYNPPPPATGAPAPSEAPTSAPCAPGLC